MRSHELSAFEIGASARLFSSPDETTKPTRLAFERSAFVKFARMIQARSSLAPDRLAPVRSEPSSFAPNRLAPDKLARLKSILLRSRFSKDFPERLAGVSGAIDASIPRTC